MLQIKQLTPAKINLFLYITGKRADGYHLLESLFAPINVFDEITITKNQSGKINCVIENKDLSGINICSRAAQLLKTSYNITSGCDISIIKNIPIAAGLGGGSSDAAATLKILNTIWELNLPNEALLEFALQIGADVPFFINPKTSLVSGVGENILHIQLGKTYYLLLINPNISINTAQVFKNGIKTFSEKINIERITDYITEAKNDLLDSALAVNPTLEECLSFLKSQNGIITASMSGSGATFFGLFNDEDKLNKAYNNTPIKWWKHKQLLVL